MGIICAIVVTALLVSLAWMWWVERAKRIRYEARVSYLEDMIRKNVLPTFRASNATLDNVTDFLEEYLLRPSDDAADSKE